MANDEHSTVATIAGSWLAIVFGMGLICGGGGSGGPTGNCEETPADEPEKAAKGELDLTLGRIAYSSQSTHRLPGLDATGPDGTGMATDGSSDGASDGSVTGDGSDAAADGTTDATDTGEFDGATGDVSSDVSAADSGRDTRVMPDADTRVMPDTPGPSADADGGGVEDADAESDADADTPAGQRFVELAGDPPTYHIVAGVQGGYHISPALLVRDVESEDFSSVVKFEVRDSSGKVLTSRACSEATSARWFEQDGGYVFHGLRVIFKVPRGDVVGKNHTMVVDAEVGDERKVVEREIRIEAPEEP